MSSKKKKCLFVLGGFSMGGAETYVLRLAKIMSQQGHDVVVLLLSKNVDEGLYTELSKHAKVVFSEYFPWMKLNYSNWLNAFLPLKWNLQAAKFDFVHVVDCLTLSFVYFNREVIHFDALSIGIYHIKEIVWWRGRTAYFRERMLKLLDENIDLALFGNEVSVVEAMKWTSRFKPQHMHIVPLGVDLSEYSSCLPLEGSRKIVSVGRLVDFKTYNEHVISVLEDLRLIAPFEYYIYGDGPNREYLKSLAKTLGVSEYVHFMGTFNYKRMPEVLSQAFCFVGSGTALIEASACGVPSLIGQDSEKEPVTPGFFCDVKGYSINTIGIDNELKRYGGFIKELYLLDRDGYGSLSDRHRVKSLDFDIENSVRLMLELTNRKPSFTVKFNRWRGLLSFAWAVLRYGPRALKTRFDE